MTLCEVLKTGVIGICPVYFGIGSVRKGKSFRLVSPLASLAVSFIAVPSHHGLQHEGYGGELLIDMHTRTLHV